MGVVVKQKPLRRIEGIIYMDGLVSTGNSNFLPQY